MVLFLDNLHPDSNSKRSVQLSAASLIGEIGCSLLNALESGYILKANNNAAQQQQMFYDLLNDRIQNIATSTTNLVLQYFFMIEYNIGFVCINFYIKKKKYKKFFY